MPRHARTELNASFFHVMCQGINKEFIFDDNEFKKKYLNLMKKHIEKVNIDVICYCIMSNHVHILIYTNDVLQMSKYMKYVNTEFAQYYNFKKERVGFVFRDRFKSQPINNKRYLYQCINYIHMNPVNAQIVLNCEDYEFSSYNVFLSGKSLGDHAICDDINIQEVESVEKCSDFYDVDYDKSQVIKEYVHNFSKKYNMNIETIKKDSTKRSELIKTLLESGNISKIDIQNILKISYWKITDAVKSIK